MMRSMHDGSPGHPGGVFREDILESAEIGRTNVVTRCAVEVQSHENCFQPMEKVESHTPTIRLDHRQSLLSLPAGDSMSLPHELLDKILGYLPSSHKWDQQSLRNCSLVAKSWTNPSRRHLFKTVKIREATLQSWLNTISPANDEFLQHVHSLSYFTSTIARQDSQWPAHRIDVLQDYLPSFHRLQYLSLSSIHIPSDISRQVEMFSTFRHTLSRLSLGRCSVTINALVALINCFSNLDCLNLSSLLHVVDGKPPSSLSRPLIRELCISELHEDGLGILDQLSELGLVSDKLVVEWRSRAPFCAPGLIANSPGVNAKCIRLRVHGCGMYT